MNVVAVSYTHLDVYKRQALHSMTESTFANHTYKNIDNNMDILHVHTKDRKLDTLEQLEIYKHIKTTSYMNSCLLYTSRCV